MDGHRQIRSSRLTCAYLHVGLGLTFRARRCVPGLEPGSGLVAWPPWLLRAAGCGLRAVVWVIWVCRCRPRAGGAGGYGGAAVAARLVRVLRRRRRVLGGRPAAARWASSAWRACQAVRIRWLRTASRQASQSVTGVRPMSRVQPRAMLLVAGSLAVAKVRSALVRRA